MSHIRCTITYGATSWSQAMEELLTEKDEGQPLYADSAYTGEEQEKSRTRVRVVRQGGWLCGKQHEWFICADHRIHKGQSENRDDELNLQYLSLCSIKISSCHGIGMPFRKNQNCTTN